MYIYVIVILNENYYYLSITVNTYYISIIHTDCTYIKMFNSPINDIYGLTLILSPSFACAKYQFTSQFKC